MIDMSNANTADDFDHNAIDEDELAYSLVFFEAPPDALSEEDVEFALRAYEQREE